MSPSRERSLRIIARVPEWPRCKLVWSPCGVLAYARIDGVLYRGDAADEPGAAVESLDRAIARVEEHR